MSGAWIILKTGSTLPEIAERRGDFEDWIREGMGMTPADVDVVPVFEGACLPRPETVRAVIVTGSSAMVTAQEAWSVKSAAWLKDVFERHRPILGICYGHQLLADALGGCVGKNPNGREIGTVSIQRTEAGRKDPLLSVLSDTFWAQESHSEAVVGLPPAATLLARNQAIESQAFVMGRAWGVQFHPEFDADIVRSYIRRRYEAIRAEGGDPERLERESRDSDTGPLLLRRFAEIVRSS
jgi:GMP synthase (glutamine-hydrolysing)